MSANAGQCATGGKAGLRWSFCWGGLWTHEELSEEAAAEILRLAEREKALIAEAEKSRLALINYEHLKREGEERERKLREALAELLNAGEEVQAQRGGTSMRLIAAKRAGRALIQEA